MLVRSYYLIRIGATFLIGAVSAIVVLHVGYVTKGSYALEIAKQAANPQDHLAQAALALERAKTLTGPNPLILRRLAEVYALQERYHDALTTLEQARQLAPESLLIYQQLADLYLEAGRIEESVRLYEEVLGFKSADFLQQGDRFFAEGHYEDALRWYDRLRFRVASLSEDTAFRYLVAAWRVSPDYANQIIGSAQVGLFKCDNQCRINGADLRLLQSVPEWGIPYGTALGIAFEQTGNLNSAPDGWLWFAGSAGCFVRVQEAGEYQLLIAASHRGPPPVEIAIEHNTHRLREIFVASKEGEWQSVKQTVLLQPGLNLLEIRFLNPLVISGGEDRKLRIRDLKLVRMSTWLST